MNKEPTHPAEYVLNTRRKNQMRKKHRLRRRQPSMCFTIWNLRLRTGAPSEHSIKVNSFFISWRKTRVQGTNEFEKCTQQPEEPRWPVGKPDVNKNNTIPVKTSIRSSTNDFTSCSISMLRLAPKDTIICVPRPADSCHRRICLAALICIAEEDLSIIVFTSNS